MNTVSFIGKASFLEFNPVDNLPILSELKSAVLCFYLKCFLFDLVFSSDTERSSVTNNI